MKKFKFISLFIISLFLISFGVEVQASKYDTTIICQLGPSTDSIVYESDCLLNEEGAVLGHAFRNTYEFVNFIWDQNNGLRILDETLALPPNVQLDEVIGFNSDQFIGKVEVEGKEYPFECDDDGFNLIDLPGAMVRGINNRGEVLLCTSATAIALAKTNSGQLVEVPQRISHSYLWTKDYGLQAIPIPEEFNKGEIYPIDFNDNNQILFADFGAGLFFILEKGEVIKVIANSSKYLLKKMPLALNNHGDLVGLNLGFGLKTFGMVWSSDGKEFVTSKKALNGGEKAIRDINDHQMAVGSVYWQNEDVKMLRLALLWDIKNNHLRDLNKYIDKEIGITLEEATAINNKGQILAVARTTADKYVLVLLTPL